MAMNQSQSPSNTDTGRVAFIQACWHRDIVDQCKTAFLAEIARAGKPAPQVDLFEVPGVFEIPLHAQLLAKTGRYDAIVATGFIVDGGIYRHEFVSTAVIDGLMRVQLDTEVPVLSAVLTPQRFHEHETHTAFFREHFLVKGKEVAEACLATVAAVTRLRSQALRAAA
ncbi:6,7-dimethyl-8-ribityllumazine synthase [Inquilinus sp. 2KB_12]